MRTNPKITSPESLKMNASFNKIMDTGIPLLYALNSLNRSMGENDPYPFIISEPVKKKLEFIHNLLKGI
jgi:hypothetical protein